MLNLFYFNSKTNLPGARSVNKLLSYILEMSLRYIFVIPLVIGHADSYEAVSIRWVGGHTPLLQVFDDGVEIDNVDVSDLTADAIHGLLVNHGFAKKEQPTEKWIPNQPDVGADNRIRNDL